MEKAWCRLAQVVGMVEAVGMCACGLHCIVGVTRVTVTDAGMEKTWHRLQVCRKLWVCVHVVYIVVLV